MSAPDRTHETNLTDLAPASFAAREPDAAWDTEVATWPEPAPLRAP